MRWGDERENSIVIFGVGFPFVCGAAQKRYRRGSLCGNYFGGAGQGPENGHSRVELIGQADEAGEGEPKGAGGRRADGHVSSPFQFWRLRSSRVEPRGWAAAGRRLGSTLSDSSLGPILKRFHNFMR